MKSVLLQSLRTALAVLLLAGAASVTYRNAGGLDMPQRLLAGALMVGGVAALFAVLFRRVRSEDRIARLEADLCREQNARSQADQALAEADLLLARLTARAGAREGVAPEAQLIAHVAQVQAELSQIRQHNTLDPVCAGRIGRACDRLAQVARIARTTARAAEPG